MCVLHALRGDRGGVFSKQFSLVRTLSRVYTVACSCVALFFYTLVFFLFFFLIFSSVLQNIIRIVVKGCT